MARLDDPHHVVKSAPLATGSAARLLETASSISRFALWSLLGHQERLSEIH